MELVKQHLLKIAQSKDNQVIEYQNSIAELNSRIAEHQKSVDDLTIQAQAYRDAAARLDSQESDDGR